MASFNKVMLIGNLTRDPVLKTTTSGFSICEFGLAVSRKYRTQQGEERTETCFIDINFMGKQADVCNRYLHKGDPVYIEGRLKYDSWTDKTTQKQRSRLLVIGDAMQFLGLSRNNAQNQQQDPAAPPQQQFSRPAPFNQPQQMTPPPPPAFNGPDTQFQQPPRPMTPPPPPPMGGNAGGAEGGEDFYEDLPF